jgi:hypothetical protein
MDPRILDELDRMDAASHITESHEEKIAPSSSLHSKRQQALYEDAMAILGKPNSVAPGKYDRIRKLISDVQNMLWKIEDYENGSQSSPEDRDIQEDVIKLYKVSIGKTLGRLNSIWGTVSGENVPQETPTPVAPEAGAVAYASAPIALAANEEIVSPQGISYKVVEINESKVLIEDGNKKQFNVSVETAVKWKK